MPYREPMGVLESASTLCRILVRLDRARATGVLRLRTTAERGSLWLFDGRVVQAKLDGQAATAPRRVYAHVVGMCVETPTLRFFAGSKPGRSTMVDPSIEARQLGLETMRRAVNLIPTLAVGAELGIGHYRLTRAGIALLDGVCLGPEERAVASWLERGVSAEDVATLPDCGLAGSRFLLGLKLLGAAAKKGARSSPLLLRKRQQLRRAASAHALLDLPEDAPRADARCALRKLVRDLHPDRFGDGAPPALQRASGEIVTALVDAATRIAAS